MKRACILFLLVFNCYFSLCGKILQIDTLERFLEEAGPLDERSLVLFDVDYTLIVPKDVILGPKGKEFSHQLIKDILENPDVVPPGKYSLDDFFGRVLATAPFTLVETKTPALIEELQTQGIPVFAFTAAESGKIGEISSFCDFRIQQLRDFGFNFKTTFPQMETLKLQGNDPTKGEPLFKSGVLFTSDHPKGEILKQFLIKSCMNPHKVIFIDDDMSYLQSVEAALDEMQIEFIGLHYVAAEKNSKNLDEKIGIFQFTHLAEKGEWLTDEKAKEQLKKIHPCIYEHHCPQ